MVGSCTVQISFLSLSFLVAHGRSNQDFVPVSNTAMWRDIRYRWRHQQEDGEPGSIYKQPLVLPTPCLVPLLFLFQAWVSIEIHFQCAAFVVLTLNVPISLPSSFICVHTLLYATRRSGRIFSRLLCSHECTGAHRLPASD